MTSVSHRLPLLLILAAVLAATAASPQGPESGALAGWKLKFHDFPLGAWLGPDGTDGEVRVYKEAGFNIVMVGRYMAHGTYADPAAVARELDLVHRYGLAAMIDTYTQNDRPWGGVVAATPMPGHHNASLAEIKWVHERFGKHPAVIGYMLGDDQGQMDTILRESTDYLRANAPETIPWVCGWVRAADLAANHNPFANWQIYPTLYNTGETAEVQARMYCEAFRSIRDDCYAHGVSPWPMFNADGNDVSDSTLRFPICSALAYGAQGLWYFTYRNALTKGAEGKPGFAKYKDALANTKPNYAVAKEANHKVLGWGPSLLGTRSVAIYSTGWAVPDATTPGADKLITQMSDDLLVGVLVKTGERPMVMVVDKRVSKKQDALPAREVEVTFASAVGRVELLGSTASQFSTGRTVRLSLKAGDGGLVRLVPVPGKRAALGALVAASR